jgi:hypothetical protein
MTSPYKHLNDYQFWRRAVSAVEPHAVDPVVHSKFTIAQTDRVSTAGSCFAQHISRRLSNIGFNYYVPESGDDLSQEERTCQNYGVFSARYGNIYTVRQLLQLFEEALGHRTKSERPWVREDGRFVDPFRPAIAPAGFDSADEVLSARADHLEHVKRVFLDSDIFVFTLGLTESWLSRSSGDVFPLAPGVSGGSYDPETCEFVNFSVSDVIADLRSFLTQLKTVSPVPLIATFENRHALVSTTYSKSVLRVAAEAALQEFEWVDYFPSYEIITGNFNSGHYYETDLREINSTGVSHAMRCFLRHYVAKSADADDIEQNAKKSLDEFVGDDAVPRIGSVVCDEELIERVSF